jgi:hypothetical protein
MKRALPLILCLLSAGCVVQDTKPQAKIQATQAVREIPGDERLDVVIHSFDPGIPADLAADEDALAKKRIYPDLRKAEARYFPVMLRNTLESSAQWGAVRVAPESVQFVDLAISGKIIESTGKHLAIEVTARDAAGRTWLQDKRYESDADIGSYKTDAALQARDPFQNLYSMVANDLLGIRAKFGAAALRELRQVADLEFAQDIAPAALSGYLVKDPGSKPPLTRVARLPAENDPMEIRVKRIRERDTAVVDTLDGYYLGFAEQMQQSYGEFRRTSYDEIEKEDEARSSARMRTILGAAAVAASILVPSSCNSQTSCNVMSAARYAGSIGGVTAFLSGLKKYADARTHAQSFGELARSFQSEVAPQVVEVEGRSLKLSGSTEEQYREWRRLLREYGAEDLPQAAAQAAPAASAASATQAP